MELSKGIFQFDTPLSLEPSTSTFLLGCNFFHAPPFYVVDYSGRIYYVVHRLQFMSRTVIHLGVHNHHVTNEKCQKFIEEIRRLITKEVDCTLNAKISTISLNANKMFLVSYLFHDSSDGTVELFKGEQLEYI
jgi:hypothetical protein